MSGGNPEVDFNVFENYSMHVLRPPNIETGEPELKIVSDKYQYKDKFILKNQISGVKWNQISGTIKET